MQNKLQELTDRLYNEGLSKGKQEGEELLAKAKVQAEEIVAKAQAEAAQIVAAAQKQAEEISTKTASDVKMASTQSLAATKKDIEKIQEEIDHRRIVVRQELLQSVKEARAHGDLSENFEYHAAKRERGKNESRIRYLRNMIKTAIIIDTQSDDDKVGLFDTVTYYVEEDECEETVRIATSLRRDLFQNIISKESPLGSALMGKKQGDRVEVKVSVDYSYFIVIRKIEKGSDDESLDIRKY